SSPVLVSGDRVGQAVVRFTNSGLDRKSTRLNSSHVKISYAVFCLKKKGTTASSTSPSSSCHRSPSSAGKQPGFGRCRRFFFLNGGGPTQIPPFPSTPRSRR